MAELGGRAHGDGGEGIAVFGQVMMEGREWRVEWMAALFFSGSKPRENVHVLGLGVNDDGKAQRRGGTGARALKDCRGRILLVDMPIRT